MKATRFFPLLLLVLLLSGCSMPTGDELLQAPQPSKNYQTLQTELSAVLASGASYTAPVSGSHRSTVQLIDLDNDGVDEAVSFFRTTNTEKPLEIYIFRKNEENYVLTGRVAGMGTGVQSVDYPIISADGRRGMVISWKLTGEGAGSAVTVCVFNEHDQPTVVLETEYTAMQLVDLTADGAQNLLLLAPGVGGKRVARLYRFADSGLEQLGETATNAEAVSVTRMSTGAVRGDIPAVFAEEKTENGIGLTTDIFVYVDGALRNLSLDSEDATTSGTYRPLAVYASDINGDGITEMPRAVLMAGYTDASAADALYMLDWYQYSVTDPPARVRTTYQNVAEEWSFTIDNAWHDRITAVKATDNGMSTVKFSQYVSVTKQIDLFTVYCATGTLGDYYSGREDLIQLGQTSGAVFFARLSNEASQSDIIITAEGIAERFSLVPMAWN